MSNLKKLASVLGLTLLAACSSLQKNTDATTEITIFSINDFHGQLQSDHPVPYMAYEHDPTLKDEKASVPSGGFAYLSTLLQQRRALAGPNILVGAGDLIGASPASSAILKDEPVIEAMNQLGLEVSAVGNHEFDAGQQELDRKIKGQCPVEGCKFPGFHGAQFTYLAANVISKATGEAWLKPYIIRKVGDVDVAFIGAVTRDLPTLVSPDGIRNFSVMDEADAINRYVPEIKRQGVAAIVVLIHEGGMYKGAANDSSYQCDGLEGPIIDIANRLDPAVDLIVSAHTHQAYTCRIAGKLVVSGRNYGSLLTETKLKIDRHANKVVEATAHNYEVDQRRLAADPKAQKLVDQIIAQTAAIRTRVITTLPATLTRDKIAGYSDTSFGDVVADAQLDAGSKSGGADIAFMNSGGIRNDLLALQTTYGEIYAAQPFGNGVVKMTLSGAQILDLLNQQWDGHSDADANVLYVSRGFSYAWRANAPLGQHVSDVRLNGHALVSDRRYTVIVNSFLAEGGGGFSILKQGADRQLLGADIDALEVYMTNKGVEKSLASMQRVRRLD